MDLSQLIAALSQPTAYPHAVTDVQVRHTHISVVFLAGPFAYKVKKPVRLGFADFATLEARHHFCEEEVRLNRRLAPNVYLGVLPITQDGDIIYIGGSGRIIEWAVHMVRLPEDATLARRLERGEATPTIIQTLAGRIAAFHASLPAGTDTAGHGSFPAVARNARDNFTQAAPLLGTTLSQIVYDRLIRLTNEELERQRPLIEARAARGVPRDTHGDLHLDHVYYFPLIPNPSPQRKGRREERPPADLVIVDCIEFNERFRFADPMADMAFLVMDLHFHGRADLAHVFADSYFRASGDDEGRALLPLYASYRAAVRGKVEGLELAEPEVPQAERQMALARARAHWLLALSLLEEPGRRPGLVLVTGLPGTGKSTLARLLAERAGFEIIRSDMVRKELISQPEYSLEESRRTYAECLRRAETLLFEGRRVLVDANFRREEQRRLFLEAAKRWAVPAVLFVCRAEPATIKARLAGRRGDASDADWSIFEQLAQEWEELSEVSRRHSREVLTDRKPEATLAQALASLHELELLN
jgi:aminoglycoside phosphotransferase family enzyme/predicted kinase